jgi:hypothetical protein
VLEALHTALRCRDAYAIGAGKWGDPRAGLIEERLWACERDTVLTALGLDADPCQHLTWLAENLDSAYRQVAAGLPANHAVSIQGGKLQPSRLEAAPDPPGLSVVRDAVAAAMLPQTDYPELLLEVHARTGMFDAFTHISGFRLRREDLDITLAALTVARSCNLGLVPVAKAGGAGAELSPADRGGEGLLPRRGHLRSLGGSSGLAGRDRHHRGLGRRAGRLR